MRKIILLFILFGAGISLKAQTTFTDPIAYNDYIIEQQLVVGEAIEAIFDFDLPDSALIWATYDLSLVIVKQANANIKSLKPFEGDSTFITAAIELFAYYEKTFINDYPEFITFFLENDPLESETEEMNQRIEFLANWESELDTVFTLAQENFAKSHNFTLTTDEEEDY